LRSFGKQRQAQEMNDDKKLSITQWAVEDRPREKLLLKGAQVLTTAELIAILLGSGNDTESAVDLAKRIFQTHNNDLSQLFRVSINDLKKFKGVGEAKAVTIASAIELARRYEASKDGIVPETVRSSVDAYKSISPILFGLKHEEFWILSLSQSNRIISKYKIGQGGIASTTVDLRIIFQKALSDNATGIIICHNHPSGSDAVSKEDKSLTERIKNAATMLDIKLFDHIIVTGETYVSFADTGLL
jgi:DNA repair protein RadC